MLRVVADMRLYRTALAAAAIGLTAGAALTAQSTGDAMRGKALIESNACFDCHRIDQRGSRVGPDLSDIGTGERRIGFRRRFSIPMRKCSSRTGKSDSSPRMAPT